jgi:hypothetical protein
MLLSGVRNAEILFPKPGLRQALEKLEKPCCQRPGHSTLKALEPFPWLTYVTSCMIHDVFVVDKCCRGAGCGVTVMILVFPSFMP